jgi:hypothetical protein
MTEIRKLRKKAHDLLDEVFPKKFDPKKIARYNWLTVSGPWRDGKVVIHCAMMTIPELTELIGRLEQMKVDQKDA